MAIHAYATSTVYVLSAEYYTAVFRKHFNYVFFIESLNFIALITCDEGRFKNVNYVYILL